jgi:hypothetical protein
MAAAIALLVPAIALATSAVAVTGPAVVVSSTSATLTGTVNPEGNAVAYEFRYGTTTAYGQTTAPAALPASSSADAVKTTVTGLKPGTTYYFQLLVGAAGSGQPYYYPATVVTGADVTFKTPAAAVAKLTLSNTKLTVSRGVAAIKLKCTTAAACKGKLTLTELVKVKRKLKRETLGTASVSIKVGHSATVKLKLDKLGKSLITKAKGRRFGASLFYRLSTGKAGFTKHVTL